MSKQFEAKKISYTVVIREPVVSSLDDYYKLKNIYDSAVQKKKKVKCINCRKADMASLIFNMKDRNLVCLCPTKGCASNMIIPIETCKTYDDFYNESKQTYENTVNSILSTKFKILFGYMNEKESDIVHLKEMYKSDHEHYMQCITDYKDIVYPKQNELNGLEERRDDLLRQLKNPDADVKKIYKDLQPILCEIRKLKYTKDTPDSSHFINMPYSITDLQSCSPVASTVVISEEEKDLLFKHLPLPKVDTPKIVKPKVVKPKKIEINTNTNENLSGMSGKVYLASMNLRGNRAPAPEGAVKVNVTSAQGLTSKNRLDFSPMTPIEGGYMGYWNFEAFWQSGKVFEGIPDAEVKKYWHGIKEAKRRYPNSKGKKVLYAKFEHDPEKMDYVTSRKKIYVPLYFELMKDKEMAQHWKKEVESGKDIVVYDFDGPRLPDGSVSIEEVTPEFIQEKINDPSFPFGHGYIVAAWFKGITPDQYV